MLKDKNILYLAHSYANFQKNQIEVLAKHFKRVFALVRYKPIAEISLVLPIRGAEGHTFRSQFDLDNVPENVTVIPVPLWYLPFGVFYQFLGEYHYKKVCKLINKHDIQFDFIHAHFVWTAGYVGARLKEKYKVPFVLTVHESDRLIDALNRKQKGFIYALEQADTIIRVNKNTIPLLLPYNNEIRFIPNGYKPELFYKKNKEQMRRMLGLPLDKKILINIGWLTKVKGQKFLVSAISELVKKQKNVLCLIVGVGPIFNKLQKQIDSLGLNSAIKLIGKVKHEKIVDWINASDVFVFSSLSESFGIVVAEAMACGKPVVATINGGSEELITNKNVGLLCEKANQLDLAKKIEEAIEKQWNEDLIIAHAKKYEYQHFASEVLKLYNSFIKTH